MSNAGIKLYYKNVMADVIGDEHGISNSQLQALADKTSPLIYQINEERKEATFATMGKESYEDLIKVIQYQTEIDESFLV